jgi:hypothetical protein
MLSPGAHMAYTAILQRIRLLIPAEPISNMTLARAISEFTNCPPNEASIATLEKRLNPQY